MCTPATECHYRLAKWSGAHAPTHWKGDTASSFLEEVRTVIQLFRSTWRFIWARWYGKIAIFAFLILAPALVYGYHSVFYVDLPEPTRVYEVVHTNKVWSEKERQLFYHSSQGSEVMPIDWFLALEQPDSSELFRSNDYMSRFRFIP